MIWRSHPMPITPHLRLPLLLALLGLLLQACGSPPSAATPPASTVPASAVPATETKATVKVAMLPFISFAPFYIAQEEGFFAEQGLNVELVNITLQQDVVPALASGQVDVAS